MTLTFNAPYEPLLFDVGRLPFPRKGREQETLTALSAVYDVIAGIDLSL
jgi:hypothetical protein